MRRREFITLLGGAAAAWPLAARAQQPKMPVIGYLDSERPELAADRVQAFRRGLGEAGFVEGKNVTIEYRWANSRYERLPELAADLVRSRVSVIFAFGPAAAAAKAATGTIPIVFAIAPDPVQGGLVASLNRPGANVTGVTSLNTGLVLKRLELLHELLPEVKTLGALVYPISSTPTIAADLQSAARTLGLDELHLLFASTEREIDMAFATFAQLRIRALVIGASAFFSNRAEQLAALSLRHAIPAIFYTREFAAAGGLMSYGASNADAERLAAVYVGRILNGERPADLPVQQAVKIELVINLKTANAFGLSFPLTLLGRADEVIE